MATLALVLALTSGGTAGAASTPVTLSISVPSVGVLGNACTSTAATDLGTVLPGASATTATGAGACRVTFGSTNDSSMLRISQADGAGAAMGLGMVPPVVQRRDNAPGRELAIFGADASLAYQVGNGATIRRTTNGGANSAEWTLGATWYDVEMVPGDQNTWWFVGSSHAVYRTTNGLVATPTFTNQSAPLAAAGWPSGNAVRGITIPAAGTMVVVGDNRWIGVSTDSGATWTAFQHANASVGNLVSVDAVSATTMAAVDDAGHVLVTTTGADASAKWGVTALTTSAFLHVAMPATNRIYAVGASGAAWSWNGTAWTDRTTALGAPGDVTGVTSASSAPDVLFACDEQGTVYRSGDLGATWTMLGSNTGNRMAGIHTPNGVDVYTTSSGRTITASHDGGATFAKYSSYAGNSVLAIAHAPAAGRIAVEVGAYGEARRTTDGGGTWTIATTPTTTSLLGVSLASDTTGWAVGDNGVVLATTDGGASWTAQASGTTSRLLAVTAIDRLHAVAVGLGGTMVATTNGGASWNPVPSGTTRTLTAVVSRGTTAIATGAAATLLRSSDSGATWSVVAPGTLPDTTTPIIDASIIGDTAAYALTLTGRVWRSTDGGATWSALPGVPGVTARRLAALASTVVVAGLNDQVAVSVDGGVTFTTTSAATGLHLDAVDLVDTHTAYVGGQDALVERIDVSAPANGTISDFAAGSHDWTTAGFFGACLQSLSGAGAVADWTVDTVNTPGRCDPVNADPWQAVPAASTKVAHLTASGTGTADLVWGVRTLPNQLPGRYEATMVLEALAPDA